MKSLKTHIKSYQQYHQTRFTRATHPIAIFMLTLAMLIFFSWIHVTLNNLINIDVAWLIVFALVIYYLILNIRLGILSGILLGLLAWLAYLLSEPSPNIVNISIFLLLIILGFTLLAWGHHYENKHADYAKRLCHITLSPLLSLIGLLDLLNLKKYFF